VQVQRAAAERLGKLTAREHQVLERIIAGRLNKQIADDLGINERTVKLHRTNLTRTLQVQSVAELTRLTGELGLFKNDQPAE
jgi:FixJ family two-component response regulator